MDNSLISFAGVAALLVIAPGVDFALVFRNALVARRHGIATSLGVASGLLLHTALAVAGLSILLRSHAALLLLYAVSGGYLVYLGGKGIAALVKDVRGPQDEERTSAAPVRPGGGRTVLAYRSGFLVNALNPKAPVLFLSIMPQFIPAGAAAGRYTFLLGTIVVACALLWFPLVALTADRLGPLLLRPRVRRSVEGSTTLVILSLGLLQLAELVP